MDDGGGSAPAGRPRAHAVRVPTRRKLWESAYGDGPQSAGRRFGAADPGGVGARRVRSAADHFLPTAVETSITLHELRVSSGLGYWFSVTDRAPKPGEAKYLTPGVVPAGELLLDFTLLSHDKAAGLPEALALVSSARLVESATTATGGTGARALGPVYEIGLASERWVLSLELPGYGILSEEQSDHQGRSMRRPTSGRGWSSPSSLSANGVSTARGSAANSTGARWSDPLPKSGIASDRPGMALVTWTVPIEGKRIMQRNVNAYLSNRGDACVDVHLSKVNFHGGDEQLFEASAADDPHARPQVDGRASRFVPGLRGRPPAASGDENRRQRRRRQPTGDDRGGCGRGSDELPSHLKTRAVIPSLSREGGWL